MFSGLRACLNSGRSGNARTVATVDHSFWKTAIWRQSYNRNGLRKTQNFELMNLFHGIHKTIETRLNRIIHKENSVTQVAYLRKEKQTFEIDYPLAVVWAAIPEVLTSLQWTIEKMDDVNFNARVKTKPGFMSYSSNLTINGAVVDEKKCRITAEGETPVTTITSLTDFGRTSDRVQLFFEALALRMSVVKKS